MAISTAASMHEAAVLFLQKRHPLLNRPRPIAHLPYIQCLNYQVKTAEAVLFTPSHERIGAISWQSLHAGWMPHFETLPNRVKTRIRQIARALHIDVHD